MPRGQDELNQILRYEKIENLVNMTSYYEQFWVSFQVAASLINLSLHVDQTKKVIKECWIYLIVLKVLFMIVFGRMAKLWPEVVYKIAPSEIRACNIYAQGK